MCRAFFAPVISGKNHKSPSPGSGVPLRLGDVFVQDAGLLLVLVDLNIVGGVSVLHKEKRAGECGG